MRFRELNSQLLQKALLSVAKGKNNNNKNTVLLK